MRSTRRATPRGAAGQWAIGIASALLLVAATGCPGGHGAGDGAGAPPPFRNDAVAPLPDPPAPAPGKPGLSYLQLVYPGLRDGWNAFVDDCRMRLAASNPLNDESLRVVVGFIVEPDGRVVAPHVIDSSGNTDFDDVALDVVRDASPLPAPGAATLSDDGVAHLRWAFQRDKRLAGVATATLERVTWPPAKAIPAFLAAGQFDRAVHRLAEAAAAGGAVESLGKQVADAAIAAALAASDGATQRAGIRAAARGHLAQAGPALERLARGAVNSEARVEATTALGAIGAQASKGYLTSVAAGDDPAAAVAAVRALQTLGAGDQVRASIASALSGDGEHRRVALAVAAEVPVPEARAALENLVVSGGDRAERAAACAALGAATGDGPDATAVLKVLRKQLTDREAALRAACLRGIDWVARAGGGNRATYWKVVDLLRDRDEHVRAAAVRAAAHLDAKRLARELYRLRKERSPAVQAALAEALGLVPGNASLEQLLALSKTDEVVVRRAAATALRHRPEPAATARLVEMLGDPDPDVRLEALAKADRKLAAAQIHAADPEVRAAALVAQFAGQSRASTVGELATLLAGTQDVGERARIAGAWLAQ